MRLGTLIERLKQCPPTARVVFDFCGCAPTRLDSSRGDYSQLALGWAPTGHTASRLATEEAERQTVATLLAECESAIGKTFQGWKGGDYVMDIHTQVCVDNPGDWTETEIVGVIGDDANVVVLETRRERR